METRNNHQFDPWGPGAEAYDDSDSEINNIDWNNPTSFFNAIGAGKPGGLPLPKLKSPTEVRREAKSMSDQIFTSYESLHGILRRHEATIRKRWFKKTRQQRLKILLNAWPNMALIHRPDFDALRKESESERDRGTKYRESFMWPYINQEDLLNPKTLPLLLNARGRHPPSSFAAADIETIHLGLVSKAIVPIFLNEYVMILNGMTGNTRDYGKLMAWSEHPDAFDWMHQQKQFLPGEGLVILEAQQRVLAFLVQCCLQLLHDIPEASLTSDSYTVLPEPQLKPESEITGFDSLGVMAAEAPYRVPAELDLSLVESLLAARTSAAEDHLWALREDPDYFSRAVLEAMEHRQEMMKDLDGKSHPLVRRGRQEVIWGRVTSSIVSDAYLELEFFADLSNQAKNLVLLQRQYAADISPSKDLPEEYLEALLRFRHHLNQAAKGPLNNLKFATVASPPLRRLFAREPPPDARTTKIGVVSKPGVTMNAVETQLIWLLRTLWEDGDQLFLTGMPAVVDELERLIQSEPQARELLSSYITTVVGDLSIISQCVNQLSLYQPWALGFESKVAERGDEFEKEYAECTRSWAQAHTVLRETGGSSRAANLGEPSNGKFAYPIEKRRTKENVEALRRAERHLDAFWAVIDRAMAAKAGDLRGMAVWNLLSQPRILQRTREWVEPEKPLPIVSTQGKLGETDRYSSYLPVSEIYSGLQARSLDISQPKAKLKTRGTPGPAPAPATEAGELQRPSPVDRQPTFSVDARTHKVFRTIFFNPTVTSTPGELPWSDFLHAMSSVGFTIMKLYGSVWQFQPTNLDVERNILFHEPHPRGKLPFTVARRYGRRLNRAYGWFGGMFVLNEK
ncbi:hypothetical protein FQN54_006623 [Arachnomyces sp. PD_36]|nr:hypothetical protein FQN54_006623 [Arachnomyces sp. PD_36]